MNNQAVYDPRTGDLPREELIKAAKDALQKFPGAIVYFKFTCRWCGERCTFQEENTLYPAGECVNCHKETPLTYGGFTLILKLNKESKQ